MEKIIQIDGRQALTNKGRIFIYTPATWDTTNNERIESAWIEADRYPTFEFKPESE